MKDLPTREGDFFVYQENGITGDSWSGFYTSKPELKSFIRSTGTRVRFIKNLMSYHFTNLETSEVDRLDILNSVIDIAEEFGMFLHHNTITGTSVRYVDLENRKLLTRLWGKINTLANKYIFKGDMIITNANTF